MTTKLLPQKAEPKKFARIVHSVDATFVVHIYPSWGIAIVQILTAIFFSCKSFFMSLYESTFQKIFERFVVFFFRCCEGCTNSFKRMLFPMHISHSTKTRTTGTSKIQKVAPLSRYWSRKQMTNASSSITSLERCAKQSNVPSSIHAWGTTLFKIGTTGKRLHKILLVDSLIFTFERRTN